MKLCSASCGSIYGCAVLMSMWLGSCASEALPVKVEPPRDARTAERVTPAPQEFRLLGYSAWPGHGLQLTAAATGREAWVDPTTAQLVRQDGSIIPLESTRFEEASGITAILLTPDPDETVHETRLSAARALIDALPDAERIGIWSASGTLPMLAELSARHDHVRAQLSSIPPSKPQPIEPNVLPRLAARLGRVSAPHGPSVRTLVVVGAARDSLASPAPARDQIALTPAVLREVTSAGDEAGWLTRQWSRKQSPEAAAGQLADDIAELRNHLVRLGACSGSTQPEMFALEYGGSRVTFEAPVTLPELADRACEAGAAARDEYPVGETVSLELTPEELALHDQYEAARSETEFTLSVRIGDAGGVAARGHFRGQTSLDCGRKSYSVHFSDDVARRLGPRAFGSEFILLSLCKDPGAFRQVLANRLMAQLGLFPMEQRYVRLTVAGRERGVYLLLEKPDEHLKRSQVALSTVIRRRWDTGGEPEEVKYPKPEKAPDDAARALDAYRALLEPISMSDADGMFEALSKRVDIENYFRWLALQSALQCGDYVDETFFYSSTESGAPFFRNLGWDTDDLFKPCHHGGHSALPDPHELVYCAEGYLDRALEASSDVYHRYAETLAGLMRAELAPDRIERELERVHDDLFARLVDDEVCVATGGAIDGQPATCERLRPWIEELMDDFRSDLRARAAFLRDHLSRYGVEP